MLYGICIGVGISIGIRIGIGIGTGPSIGVGLGMCVGRGIGLGMGTCTGEGIRINMGIGTSASRGAGKGIALGLAEKGMTVYVTGRSTEVGSAKGWDGTTLPGTVLETAEEITKAGGKGIAVVCDHADAAGEQNARG